MQLLPSSPFVFCVYNIAVQLKLFCFFDPLIDAVMVAFIKREEEETIDWTCTQKHFLVS